MIRCHFFLAKISLHSYLQLVWLSGCSWLRGGLVEWGSTSQSGSFLIRGLSHNLKFGTFCATTDFWRQVKVTCNPKFTISKKICTWKQKQKYQYVHFRLLKALAFVNWQLFLALPGALVSLQNVSKIFRIFCICWLRWQIWGWWLKAYDSGERREPLWIKGILFPCVVR